MNVCAPGVAPGDPAGDGSGVCDGGDASLVGGAVEAAAVPAGVVCAGADPVAVATGVGCDTVAVPPGDAWDAGPQAQTMIASVSKATGPDRIAGTSVSP
jgi:hypothetical protein